MFMVKAFSVTAAVVVVLRLVFVRLSRPAKPATADAADCGPECDCIGCTADAEAWAGVAAKEAADGRTN